MKKLIMLLLLIYNPLWAQKLSDSVLFNVAKNAVVGEVLSKYDNVEISKATDGKLQAKIYAGNQYDLNGIPLVQYDKITGEIIAKSRYIKWVPDKVTKSLPVERIAGNTRIKETYTLVDDKITKLSWTLDTNATVSWDAMQQKLTFRGIGNAYMFDTPKPTAWDSGGKDVKIDASYTFGVLTYVVTFSGDEVFPVMVDPTTNYVDTDANSGTIYTSNTTYNTGRAAVSGNSWDATLLKVGQQYEAPDYYVYRSSLEFDTSALDDAAIISGAVVKIVMSAKNSITTADSLYLVLGTFSGAFSNTWFNDFGGWASGNNPYTLTKHAPALRPFGFANGDTLTFTLNAAGLSAISKTGNTPYMMIIEKDRANTAPTVDEHIDIQDDSPYIQVTYTVSFAGKVSGVSAPSVVSTVANPVKISGVQ